MTLKRHPCTIEELLKHLDQTGILEDTPHFLNPRRLPAIQNYDMSHLHMRKVYNNIYRRLRRDLKRLSRSQRRNAQQQFPLTAMVSGLPRQ